MSDEGLLITDERLLMNGRAKAQPAEAPRELGSVFLCQHYRQTASQRGALVTQLFFTSNFELPLNLSHASGRVHTYERDVSNVRNTCNVCNMCGFFFFFFF